MSVVVIVALLVLVGAFAARSALWYQTADFFCLYQGSRTLTLGADPYDEATWQAAAGGLYPDPRGGMVLPPCPGRYGYPLWTAVALLPLGALPIEPASIAWTTLSIGASILGMAAAWRAFGGTRRYAALFAVAVVMSQPFWIFLLSGQISGLTLGIAGVTAWALARGRERLGGVSLVLLALKPQTSVLAIPAVLASALVARRWRFILAALAAALVLTAVPLAFVHAWPVEWLGEVGGRRLRVISQMPTAWGFAAQTVGDPAWGVILLAAVVALAALIARGHVDPARVFVLTIPLSLLATPYAWTYDYLVLAVAWGFILACAGRSAGRIRGALLFAGLALAVALPWVLYAVSFGRGEEALSASLAALTALVAASAARTTPLAVPSGRSPSGPSPSGPSWSVV
jgi:hypothetical protein